MSATVLTNMLVIRVLKIKIPHCHVPAGFKPFFGHHADIALPQKTSLPQIPQSRVAARPLANSIIQPKPKADHSAIKPNRLTKPNRPNRPTKSANQISTKAMNTNITTKIKLI